VAEGSKTDSSLIDAVLELAETRLDVIEHARDNRRSFPPEWYDWQREGFDSHDSHIMTMAGNQTGKTWSEGYHFACDITGDYPDDWKGFKFDHQLDTTVLGVDNTQLIDVTQKALFGDLDPVTRKFSGGWVHPDEIDHVDPSQQKGLARKVYVKSRFGTSAVALRAYTQAKTGQSTLSFAGTIKDLIWADECPPDEMVGQLYMRTMNGNRGKGGRIRFTMTPELGQTDLVTSFMEDLQPGQLLIGPIDWDDCTHLTPEKQALILSGIPEHEHDMRKSGKPFFGSGLVYPIAENRIRCDPFDISPYTWWTVIRAIDLGISTNASVWLAYDPEQDIVYVVRAEAEKGQVISEHALATNKMWSHAPCVFPHDIENREKNSGKTARILYGESGLKHGVDFKNVDGSIHVEPGVMLIYERMKAGRFKVFSDATAFWREFRMYHRKDGKIVKKNDHVMDAMRQGCIMIPRYGKQIIPRVRIRKVNKAMA